MIPSINDLTSHWRFDDDEHPTRYIGILFGENILVYDDRVINLTKLLNDNGGIYNAVNNGNYMYVLLDNNNLHKIETTNFETHDLICKDVKNIYSRMWYTYILQNNGDVLDDNLKIIYKNISVVSNIHRHNNAYNYMHCCDNNNKFMVFSKIVNNDDANFIAIPNINKVIDMCIVLADTMILHDNNIISICQDIETKNPKINTKNINNVNCISPVSNNTIGIIHDNYNAIIYKINDFYDVKIHDPERHKSISIPNSPYCAKFNTQTIPYYPKYFMDRFMVFVMSVKYGCNIKLPKYLYFMIANYLR